MTRPKDPRDMQRPNRRLGEVLRLTIACPLCGTGRDDPALRVVAYRSNTARLECPVCGLRFSLDIQNWMRAVSARGFDNAMAMVVYQRHDLDAVRAEERDRKREQRNPGVMPLPLPPAGRASCHVPFAAILPFDGQSNGSRPCGPRAVLP